MNRHSQTIPRAQRGSALLAALCFCAVLGIALASYMGVCYHTLQTSSHNNQGTYSFELAETGMEEALGALNRSNYDWSDWTINTGVSPKTATKTLNGFSFGNGTFGSVTVTVENYDGRVSLFNPTVTATGTTTLTAGAAVTRTLKATAELAPLFVNAIAGTSTAGGTSSGVRFAGGGAVDSFDSDAVVPSGETEMEKYFRERPLSFSAVVSSANRIVLTDAQVHGYAMAATDSTGAVMLSYSANAQVGGPDTRASVQIDQTRLSSSPYQPVFDIKAPAEDIPLVVGGTGDVTIGSSDPDGHTTYYYTDDLNLSGTQTLTIQGNVVLVVHGDLIIEGSAKILIPVNTSLQIVMPEASEHSLSKKLFIGGNGIQNDSGKARNAAIFYAGRSATENPELATSKPFCGVVYLPNSNLDFVISSNLDFKGSIVAKTVNITGSPAIHYDLNLRKRTAKFSAIDTPFMVSSWQEVVPGTP